MGSGSNFALRCGCRCRIENEFLHADLLHSVDLRVNGQDWEEIVKRAGPKSHFRVFE